MWLTWLPMAVDCLRAASSLAADSDRAASSWELRRASASVRAADTAAAERDALASQPSTAPSNRPTKRAIATDNMTVMVPSGTDNSRQCSSGGH